MSERKIHCIVDLQPIGMASSDIWMVNKISASEYRSSAVLAVGD
jgi:hypothetical protein